MIKSRIIGAALTSIACANFLAAQTIPVPPAPATPQAPVNSNTGNTGGNVRGIWQATLPGGTYLVAVERITSVSRHSYLLDGALLVDEVTVDTTGQSLARFYFISPVGTGTPAATTAAAVERGKGMFDAVGTRTGLDLENMVIKKYPETTHAKTIEYRIPSEAQLTALFNSAKEAWLGSKGGQFTIQAAK